MRPILSFSQYAQLFFLHRTLFLPQVPNHNLLACDCFSTMCYLFLLTTLDREKILKQPEHSFAEYLEAGELKAPNEDVDMGCSLYI